MPQPISYSGNPVEDLDQLRDALYTLETFGILHEDTNNSIEYETEIFIVNLTDMSEEEVDENGYSFYDLFLECNDKQKQTALEYFRDQVMKNI